MKKYLLFLMTVVITMFTLSSCKFTNPSYDEEVALKMKPWFFGDTRVYDTPVNDLTMMAMTTDAVHFYILPHKVEFKFDDLLSNDNTPLDVSMYMVIQVQKGHTPELLKNYGEDWYKTFIEPYFKNKVREYVSTCSPFDLMSNREVLKKLDTDIAVSMRQYIAQLSKTKGYFPVEIQQVTTDRVMPNSEQLEEMNKTAAAIQAKQTQEKRAEMELARAKAEKNKAIADKAYMNELSLSPQQFIQLRAWDVIASKQGANIDVLVGSGEMPMWNIKNK